jgi:cysteine desulfuration protein SufE
MSANINETQNIVIEDFSFFDDWMQRYEQIIEMGKSLPGLSETLKSDENRVVGCQSNVWLHSVFEDGLMKYDADSDAVITKGLVALVLKILSNQTPENIIKADLYALDQIGLREHLSPNRKNGMDAMIKTIKERAANSLSR